MRCFIILGILLLDLTSVCASAYYTKRDRSIGTENASVSRYRDREPHYCFIRYLHNIMNRLGKKYFGSSVTIISDGRNDEYSIKMPKRHTSMPESTPEGLRGYSGRGGGIFYVDGPRTRKPGRWRRKRIRTKKELNK